MLAPSQPSAAARACAAAPTPRVVLARLLPWLALGMTGLGCATGRPRQPAAPSATVLEMEPIKVEAVRTDHGVEVRAYDASDLFEQAAEANAAGRFTEAGERYRVLLRDFPGSPLAPAALFNLGRVTFDLGEHEEAAQLFEEFVRRYPDGTDARDALFLRGVSLAKCERWDASQRVFEALLERDDLTPDDRVEAMARRGVARLRQGDLDDAEQKLRLVFVYRDRLEGQAEARLETDYYLAFAQLHLAEVAHQRSNQTALRWPEAQMSRDLEQKAALLLLARRRYIDAVRYGSADIAQLAAYRIGSLFQEFYDAVMAVPPPRGLEAEGQQEKRDIYFEELRKKLRVVLEKSLRGHEHNIELFERLGVESEWVAKSRAAIDRLRRLLDPTEDARAAPVPGDGPEKVPAEPVLRELEPPGRGGNDAGPMIQRRVL